MSTPIKPNIVFTFSDNPEVTCYAMLSGPDGSFVNFPVHRELANQLVKELSYYLKRQEKLINEQPKNSPFAGGLRAVSRSRSEEETNE